VTVKLGKESVELTAADILVNSQPAASLAVAADKGMTVGLDTAITPELKAEGLAREIIRRIQELRKKKGFNIEDRIKTNYKVEGDLAKVFKESAATIMAETLSQILEAAALAEGATVEEEEIDGQKVLFSLEKINLD